jgi:hypothetical protein
MAEEMDLDKKLKMRAEHNEKMRKIRNMPERETLKRFQKYELLNMKTKLVHEQQKVDGMIKEINPKQPQSNNSPKNLLQNKPGNQSQDTFEDDHKTQLQRLYEAKIQWRHDVELHKGHDQKTVVRMDENKTSGYINELN